MVPRPSRATLFPYTTLFRSCTWCGPSLPSNRPRGGRKFRGWDEMHPRVANGAFSDTRGSGEGEGEGRSEEHTSELQSRLHLVCRLLLEKKKNSNELRLRYRK